MSDFLDTTVIVRYVVGDPPEQAERARALVESGRPLRVTSVALVESAFTLRHHYGVARTEIVDGLIRLVRRRNILMHDLRRETAVRALQMCAPSGRFSFADAVIWGLVSESESVRIYSFDRRFPSEGIEVREP